MAGQNLIQVFENDDGGLTLAYGEYAGDTQSLLIETLSIAIEDVDAVAEMLKYEHKIISEGYPRVEED